MRWPPLIQAGFMGRRSFAVFVLLFVSVAFCVAFRVGVFGAFGVLVGRLFVRVVRLCLLGQRFRGLVGVPFGLGRFGGGLAGARLVLVAALALLFRGHGFQFFHGGVALHGGFELIALHDFVLQKKRGHKVEFVAVLVQQFFGGGVALVKQGLLPIIRDKETLFRITDAAIDYFQEHANPSERFRATLTRLGDEGLRETLKKAYQG